MNHDARRLNPTHCDDGVPYFSETLAGLSLVNRIHPREESNFKAATRLAGRRKHSPAETARTRLSRATITPKFLDIPCSLAFSQLATSIANASIFHVGINTRAQIGRACPEAHCRERNVRSWSFFFVLYARKERKREKERENVLHFQRYCVTFESRWCSRSCDTACNTFITGETGRFLCNDLCSFRSAIRTSFFVTLERNFFLSLVSLSDARESFRARHAKRFFTFFVNAEEDIYRV